MRQPPGTGTAGGIAPSDLRRNGSNYMPASDKPALVMAQAVE